jgi:hypothetical protein
LSETFTHDGVEYTLPSPNGLTFQSRAAAYQLYVRDPMPHYAPGTSIITHTDKGLVAEFGDMNAGVIHDAEAGEDYFPIRGHFIDTMEQAKQKGWTDEERKIVEMKLITTQGPSDHWLHTKPPVGKPWPSYDETQAGKIAEIAVATGTVAGALAYERENAKRPTVIGALKKAAEEPVEEELAAA